MPSESTGVGRSKFPTPAGTRLGEGRDPTHPEPTASLRHFLPPTSPTPTPQPSTLGGDPRFRPGNGGRLLRLPDSADPSSGPHSRPFTLLPPLDGDLRDHPQGNLVESDCRVSNPRVSRPSSLSDSPPSRLDSPNPTFPPPGRPLPRNGTRDGETHSPATSDVTPPP